MKELPRLISNVVRAEGGATAAEAGPFSRRGPGKAMLRGFWILGIFGGALATCPLSGEDAPAGPTVNLGGNLRTSAAPAPIAPPVPITPPAPAAINPAVSDTGRAVPLKTTPNVLVTDAVASMPTGGGYRANLVAMTSLRRSIQLIDSDLAIEPGRANPSFCSGATYLVFLSVLNRLNHEGEIQIDEATRRALLVQDHQPDGAGAWGRWNANGPGTARFFYETGMGYSFTSIEEARPGDFLKIFWNDEIGAREVGHSVVYLGTDDKPEGEFVRYWSSNQPNGFGIAEVPRQRIHRMLFSRLVHPERIQQVSAIPARDAYLAAMLRRPSTAEEMQRMVGIAETALERPLALAASTPVGDSHGGGAAKGAASAKTAATSSPTPAPASPPPRAEPWYKRIRLW